jgi:hypothetical protein
MAILIAMFHSNRKLKRNSFKPPNISFILAMNTLSLPPRDALHASQPVMEEYAVLKKIPTMDHASMMPIRIASRMRLVRIYCKTLV